MDVFAGIVVYLIVWWLVLFMVLPWGVRNTDEAGEQPVRGEMPGAPVKPMLWRKLLATTLIAAAVWAAVWGLIQSDYLSFHGMTRP